MLCVNRDERKRAGRALQAKGPQGHIRLGITNFFEPSHQTASKKRAAEEQAANTHKQHAHKQARTHTYTQTHAALTHSKPAISWKKHGRARPL
jgi:hypothetical protein